MPKILQATDLGARPSLRTNRQVVTDRSGEIEAQGLQVLAKTVSDIAQGMLVREDKLSYASAKSSFLTSDIDARRVIEVHDDYETWEELYREKAKAALEKAMEKIKSKPDRKLFEMDVKLAIERGAMAVRGAALKRRIDDQRAGVDEDLDKLRGAALDPKTDPGTRSDILGNALDNIESARTAGAISDQEAGDKGRAFTRDIVEGSLMTMEPEERIKALKDPKGQAKEFLHEDTRIKMLRAAEKENKDTRDRGAAQAKVDKIMEDNPEDRGEALTAARSIPDPDVRARAVTGVNARFNEMETIERENVDRIYDEATEFIGENGSLAGYEGDLNKLIPAQQKSLDDFARYDQKGVEPVHSDEQYEKWLALPIGEAGKVNLMAEYRSSFDDSHFAQAQARQLSIRDGKTEKVNQYVGDVRRIESVLVGAERFKFKPGSGRKDKKRKASWDRAIGGILRRFEEVAADKGSALTPPEKDEIIIKEMARRMWVDVRFSDEQFIVVGMSPEELAEVYVPYNEIPEKARRRLENYAQSNNWDASEEQIEKAYGAGVNRLGDARIDIILSGR